ncbi:HAMP domain-containing sensor histidine kinase [Niallia sp. 03091]|uniref:HAMP domain-containing sensor histidine kinase n=1 Tax=Niallia sp. 03091 TaxID=3458059 RepID=UPI004043F2D9
MNIVKKISLLSWKWKLTVWLSASIFFTFSIFTFFEYHTVSSWLLKQEENSVKQTMNELLKNFHSSSGSLAKEEIQASVPFMEKINTKNQLIRVTDQKGNLIVSQMNGDFPIIEPNQLLGYKKISYFTIGKQQSLIYSQSLNGKDFSGKVEIIRLLDSYDLVRKHLAFAMMLFALTTILISAGIGYILSLQLLKPLSIITKTMNKIKSAGFKERIPVYTQEDEISELSTLFNEMMDRIDDTFQQQKQFIEDASHELRTPISILEGHLSMLNRWGKKNPDILEESLQASVEEIAKLKKLVLSLLNLSKLDHPRSGSMIMPENVGEIIHHTVKDFHMLYKDFQFIEKIQYTNLYGVTEQHFQQILTILLDNAVKYSPVKKEITIETMELRRKFVLKIADNGIGIPKQDLPKVFDRFYRVDKARSREQGGTGLGLAIARKIVEYYEGEIVIESQEGVGTKVIVTFLNK